MSTNYYARTANTPADDEGLHIGKHSGGWDFLFRAHRDLDLTDCESWKQYLTQPGVEIWTESGYTVDFDQFWASAVKRPADVGGLTVMRCHDDEWARNRRDGTSVSSTDQQWTDTHGHPFSAYEFC